MADETRNDDPEGLEPPELPPTASSPPVAEGLDQTARFAGDALVELARENAAAQRAE